MTTVRLAGGYEITESISAATPLDAQKDMSRGGMMALMRMTKRLHPKSDYPKLEVDG